MRGDNARTSVYAYYTYQSIRMQMQAKIVENVMENVMDVEV